jgi:hypothetical protein
MHILFRIIKFIFFVPIVILASPGILVMTATIFLVESEEGPLRNFFIDDLKKYGFAKGFPLFMQETFIKIYKNNIQGFVVGAAGFLVVAVGLRSLGILPAEIVYVALSIEFTLLLVYGISLYFTTGEGATPGVVSKDPMEMVALSVKDLSQQVAQFTTKATAAESRIEQTHKLDSSIQALRAKLDSFPTNPHEQKEFNEKWLMTTKILSEQLALLENRIRLTESRFDDISNINKGLDALSKRLELIVGDHISLRVRQEFENMMAQLSERVHGSKQPR